MRKILLYSISLILSICTFGQKATYEEAEQNLINGNIQKAYQGFKQAADEYYQAGDESRYALSNLKMAECNIAEGAADAALKLAESTREYSKNITTDIEQINALTLSIMGEANLRLGRNDLALEFLLKEEKTYNNVPSLALAKCYSNLGVVYSNSGNKSTALAYHEQSLAIKRQFMDDTNPAIADTYNNIGQIYLEGENLQAIIFFNKALKIYTATFGTNHPKVANCYSNLAFANRGLNNFNEALQYTDLVMEIWNSNYEGDHPNKALTLSNKGRILAQKEDYDQALHIQQEALHMYLKIYGEKHPDVANCYYLIGNVYKNQAKFLQSAESYQASIFANLYSQQSTSLYDTPELRDFYNADILLFSLQSKAMAMEALHYEKSLKPRDLISAVDTYTACDELVSIIRQSRLTETDKLKLAAISSDIYNNGIRVAMDLSKHTFNKAKYQNLAFEFCERSKSAILLEAINETKAKSFSGIPANLILLEDSLKNEISVLKQKLAQSDKNSESIKKSLFEYQQAYRTFIGSLETNFPSYFNLKYNQTYATADDLKSKIDDQTAILSYFTGTNIIYVFSITNKGMEVFEIPKEENFIQMVKAFRNSIKHQIFDSFKKSSSSLYAQLIPKLNPRINRLIILPDGILGTIPFEAFTQSSKSEASDYQSLDFLLKKYAVSYDYAATLLLDRLKSQKSDSETNGILLTAPITFSKNEMQMAELPGTKEEVKEIKYLFVAANQDSKVLTGSDANENFIKTPELAKFRYLHFATHGIVNESKPELSRIFLSPNETEDGNLYSGEIYSLKIKAALVTLSACETGLGQIAKGEGIVGLSRSLMYAGAQNLIVSLWQVSDASTSQLMIDFYKIHLKNLQNELFNDDLRIAKMQLLSFEKYSAPYYWAPFILVGN
jgi:CHAT domain-containing protein